MAATAVPRRLIYLPLDDVVGAVRNPKAHDLALIRESVSRHGFIDPILRDERTGRLVGGHGRLDYLREALNAGETAPDGIVVDRSGRWKVPVIVGWASRDDADAERVLLSLNRVSERGGWKQDELAAMLADLAASDDGLDGTGYEPVDLDALIAQIGTASGDAVDAAHEWNRGGMPHFTSDNLMSDFHVTVHFRSPDDYEAFLLLLDAGRPVNKSMWWPESDGHKGCDLGQEYALVADGD
jgi:hypothetical protein